MHNSREGLAPKVIKTLLALEGDHPPLRIESWGYEELWQRVLRLEPESLQSLLGPAPMALDQSGEVVLRHLRRLIEELSSRPLALMGLPNQAAGTAAGVELSAQAGERSDTEQFVQHHHLEETLKSKARLIVVGPGGSGKSTALRRSCLALARALAADAEVVAGTGAASGVPVLLPLASYRGSLPEALAAILRTDALTADALLRQGRLVLFLDDFDLLKKKAQLLEELQVLCRLAPSFRYILATRPDPALGAIGPSIAARYEILPLDDSALTALFTIHLGVNDAEVLLKALEDQYIVDAFRLPLMAWFATVEFREFKAAPRTVARGAIFQRVIDRLLVEWSPQRREGLGDPHSELKLKCLRNLAREMVTRNAISLAKEEVERVFRAVVGRAAAADPAELLDEVTSEPLFEGTRDLVQFRHLSLRDHFAAAWLAQHATPWQIAYLCRNARWHEAVIHLVGFLDEVRTRALLRPLVKLTPIAVAACSVNSMRWSADWIFLVIRCLVESPQPIDDLRDMFLDQIRRRAGRPTFWLGQTTHPTSSWLRAFGVYVEFDSLIGRLGTRSAFEFVRSRADRRSRIAGLGQFRNADGAAALLAEFDEPETRGTPGDDLAAYFLLRFPPELLLSQGESYLRQADPAVRSRLLGSLSRAQSWSWPAKSRDFSRWTPLLVEAVLADERAVGDATLSFLRPDGWLDTDAERLFLDALGGTDGVRRYRAIWPLVYSQSGRVLEALTHALRDPEIVVGVKALDALRIRDGRHFADHVITLLKSHVAADVEPSLAQLVSSAGQSLTSRQRTTLEKFLWLQLGIGPGNDEDLRCFCVRALGQLAFDSSSFLIPMFQDEKSPRLRENALGSLAQVLGNGAAPYLVRGLEDADKGVQEEAAYRCRFLTGPAAREVLPYLRALSSKSVNCKIAIEALSRALDTPDVPQ